MHAARLRRANEDGGARWAAGAHLRDGRLDDARAHRVAADVVLGEVVRAVAGQLHDGRLVGESSGRTAPRPANAKS